jgi:anti-sigma B factor antagonist
LGKQHGDLGKGGPLLPVAERAAETRRHRMERWGRPDERRRTAVVKQELRVTLEPSGSGGSGPVLRVSGEVDIQTSPILDEHLQRVLEGASSMVVDLGGVTFLDSTGLSVLIGGLKRCESAGGALRVASPRPNVRRVFEVTGLAEVFQIAPGEEPAPD